MIVYTIGGIQAILARIILFSIILGILIGSWILALIVSVKIASIEKKADR